MNEEILKKKFSFNLFVEERREVRKRRKRLSIKFLSPLSEIPHHLHLFHSLLRNHHHECSAQCFFILSLPCNIFRFNGARTCNKSNLAMFLLIFNSINSHCFRLSCKAPSSWALLRLKSSQLYVYKYASSDV